MRVYIAHTTIEPAFLLNTLNPLHNTASTANPMLLPNVSESNACSCT